MAAADRPDREDDLDLPRLLELQRHGQAFTFAEGVGGRHEHEMEAARLQLVEREQRLVNYRLAHSGELPTQVNSNMQQMANISAQLQTLAQAANAARQRQIQFERDLTVVMQTPASALATMTPAPAQGRGNTPPTSTVQQLADARRQLELHGMARSRAQSSSSLTTWPASSSPSASSMAAWSAARSSSSSSSPSRIGST